MPQSGDIIFFTNKKGVSTHVGIVEKVIVGGYDEEGNPTPYKLTFVLKCNQTLKVDNAKADYRANQKGKKVS